MAARRKDDSDEDSEKGAPPPRKPSNDNILLMKLLDLDNPTITPNMVDFLLKEEICEMFMNFISRAPPREGGVGSSSPISDSAPAAAAFQRQREWSNEVAMRRSYRAMTMLVNPSKSFARFVQCRLHTIVLCLFRMFEPESDGNFHHFHRVLDYLLRTSPGDVLRDIAENNLVLPMLNYLHDATVVSCILKILQTKQADGGQRAVYESVLRSGFFAVVARKLTGDPAETEAACEFVARLATELNGEEPSELLWADLVRDPPVFVDYCMEVLRDQDRFSAEQQQQVAETLQALLYNSARIMSAPPLEAAGGMKLPPPINRMAGMLPGLCRQLVPHAPTLVARLLVTPRHEGVKLSGFAVPAKFGALRFALVDILTHMAVALPDDTLPALTGDVWVALVSWFLEYRFNNMYHNRFHRLFKVVLDRNDQRALGALLGSGLVERFVEHYRSAEKTGARAWVVLLLNLLRLKADTQRDGASFLRGVLAGNAAYQSFLPDLREETERQTKRHFVSSAGVVPFFGPHGPSATGVQYADNGIDLGSHYAAMLDFTEPPSSAASPPESPHASPHALASPETNGRGGSPMPSPPPRMLGDKVDTPRAGSPQVVFPVPEPAADAAAGDGLDGRDGVDGAVGGESPSEDTAPVALVLPGRAPKGSGS